MNGCNPFPCGGESVPPVPSPCPPGAIPGAKGDPGAMGAAGSNGVNAFTQLAAGFTVPAPGSNVTITVGNSLWMIPGQAIFVQFAGYYLVVSVLSGISASIQNLGYSTNAVAGTAIAFGSKVGTSGPIGPSGAASGITSVGLTVPSGLSVTPGSLTSAGTFAITWATGQTANRFLATPDGATGAVTLRAIVVGDLPTAVTLLGNSFNGNNELVQLDGVGKLPAISGAALTSLNASNVSSGTLADARLSGNVVLASAIPVAIRIQDTIQSASPLTGTTVTGSTVTGSSDLDVYLTPAGTLATLTMAFPSDANSWIGQVLRVLTTQAVTALTVSGSGATIYGTAVTALTAGQVVSYKKLASNVWFRLS